MLRPVDAGSDASWRSYLEAFHHQQPGITERILGRCVDEAGATPYHWVAAAIVPGRTVLDLACGSGPLRGLTVGTWVGTDLSSSELGAARVGGAQRLVLGDATELPFAGACFDVVACSMALMITQPLERALNEIARVLHPDGRLVALLPATHPLRPIDRVRFARLLLTLRRTRFGYPNDDVLIDLDDLLDQTGLELFDDRYRRFAYAIAGTDSARELVASLYLPGVNPDRVDTANRLVERWIGKTIGVPLRRIVARRR